MKYITVLEEDASIILNGDRCVTNLQELYKVLLLPDTTEIEFRSEFVDKYFTTSGIIHFVENANSLNSSCLINVSQIDSRLSVDMVKQLKALDNREDLMYALQMREHDIMSTIQMLCEYYESAIEESIAANNKVATLHLVNSNLERALEMREDDYARLLEVKNDYEYKLKTLVARINYNYDKDVNVNGLVQITGHRYDKVLYIKEISRVHYTDTFIYYLQESLKILYGVPCRLVVIEPPYAYKRCDLYPRCKPHYDLSKQDVYQSDIVMAGFQPRLVTDIIHNPAHVNYMIILDRGGYAVPHIYGNNIELLYETSDLDDIERLGLPLNWDRIISYNENTLNIPYIPNFQDMSIEERMRVYSSMPILKKVVEIMERR